MTASLRSAGAWFAVLLAAGGLAACRTPGAGPIGPVLDRDVRFSSVAPDVADHAAAELAAAALVGNREQEQRALRRLHAIDTVLAASGEADTGLMPAALDLHNASLDDDRAYRAATEDLLSRSRIDPALEERLEQSRDDDPLRLAAARIRDARMIQFGRAFNALAEPIGRSIMTWTLAPVRLARAAVQYAIAVYSEDPLPLQRRQALAHWEEFIQRYPDAPEVPALEPSVRRAEARLARTRRDQALRTGSEALRRGKTRLALVYAERALLQVPEDSRALALYDRATAQLEAERELRDLSVTAAATPGGDPAAAEGAALARALLLPDGDVEAAADALLAAQPEGPLADEARFARAVALAESGAESAMWEELDRVADADPQASNMARHAQALLDSPDTNAYAAYRHERNGNRLAQGLWVLLGPYAQGTNPYPRLPSAIGWGFSAPGVFQNAMSAPLRLIQLPWLELLPQALRASVHARTYLGHHPEGEHAEEMRDWLESYERKRGNWYGALRIVEGRKHPDPEDVLELRLKASAQALEATGKQKRRDLRLAMYREIATDFKDTPAGKAAGELARQETQNATPQRIRISRGFLLENPDVAGARGLGLKPRLLDGNARNGEIHPAGVSLVGGRVIELNFIGPDGDEKGVPTRYIRTLSEKRLARFVSQLEETQFRNGLLDAGNSTAPNAQRDVVFERARLGLADDIDPRAAAASNFEYIGLRERYGMVRARESILPFDIVISGNLSDFSLGAFPRMREPRQTPDAFLYK